MTPITLIFGFNSATARKVPNTLAAPLMNPLLTGSREAYRAIPAETVGRAMLGAARRGTRGIYRYSYSAIRQLSQSRPAQPVNPNPAGKAPA